MTDIQPTEPELLELRKSIDNIDAAMVHLLAERFRCTARVGALKARYKLAPTDPAREQAQVQRLRNLAEAAGLDPEAVGRLWRAFLARSRGFYWSRVWAVYVLIRWCSRHRVSI